MNKKYIVPPSDERRAVCQEIIKRLKGSSQRFRCAQTLFKSDADCLGWLDLKIAVAFNQRVQTVEKRRKRLVTEGFELALDGKKRQEPPIPRKLDGEAKAKLITMRLGKPPVGYGHWTLQLLADELVSLEIVDSISHEKVRKSLKERNDEAQDRVLGDPAGARRRVCGLQGGHPRNLRGSVRS